MIMPMKMKVLLIEDNAEFADMMKQVLLRNSEASFDVECAKKLQEGVDVLESHDVDAILLDLTLPDSRGLDTYTQIHNKAPHTPIVILTGMDDETCALEAIRNGAQDYLVKGQVRFEVIPRVVRYSIERNRVNQASAPKPAVSKPIAMDSAVMNDKLKACGLYPWLLASFEDKASDLFLTIGEAPTLKVPQGFKKLGEQAVSAQQMSKIIETILNDEQMKEFVAGKEVDLSIELDQLSRFRVNVFKAKGGASLAFRPIPRVIPTLDSLGLPSVLRELTKLTKGMVLVTGPTGNGKSTTLAAFIDEINRRDERHIITIEDPIEYVIPHQKCLIHQREVELHTRSFADGLRSALREHPDIIMVGELRDLETISMAVRAAETGHFVLATLHSGTTTEAITRILDVFENGQKGQIQASLAQSLQAVVTQRLLKKMDGTGLVVATEVLIPNPAIRNIIRAGQLAQIKMYLEMGRKEGMRTMEHSVKELAEKGLIPLSAMEEFGPAVKIEPLKPVKKGLFQRK